MCAHMHKDTDHILHYNGMKNMNIVKIGCYTQHIYPMHIIFLCVACWVLPLIATVYVYDTSYNYQSVSLLM